MPSFAFLLPHRTSERERERRAGGHTPGWRVYMTTKSGALHYYPDTTRFHAPPDSFHAMRLPGILLFQLLLCTPGTAESSENPADAIRCSDPDIKNGIFTLSDGLHVDSVLTLSCNSGYYPYPVQRRTCKENGMWTERIYCKEITCPKPTVFEFGSFGPRSGAYRINATLNFECSDGYIMQGSSERTCMRNGKWNGTTTICENWAGHCPNPGIPLGAIKTGIRYQIDDKVRYKCDKGLDLVGSEERVCQESGEWTGTEPSCHAPYSFDLPEDIQAQFHTSVANLLELMNPYKEKKAENLGRRVTITKNGTLNIYILVDASESVKEDDFNKFKEAVKHFILAFSSFDVFAHFGIFSYATEVKTVIAVYDESSDDTGHLDDLVTNIKYTDHKGKSGTNIRLALDKVYEMMVLQKERVQRNKGDWASIRHVILLLTDGKANMGGRPREAIRLINDVLEIGSERQDFLDIYAFGVGTLNVDVTELNEIASKKKDEKHVFVVETAEELKDSFDNMLDLRNIGDMCGVGSTKETSETDLSEKVPWHVKLQVGGSKCRGSLIAKNWILTAAHCFPKSNEKTTDKVTLGDDKTVNIDQFFIHPCYDVNKLRKEGINESYDYDVALVRLAKNVAFSDTARPICIPCTEATNRALKLSAAKKACKYHKERLLSGSEKTAKLVTIYNNIREVSLKVGDKQRDPCTNGIKTWPPFENVDLAKLIPLRFLCTEGPATCKGESGGALYISENFRHYELGVVSWGVFEACKDQPKDKRKSPPKGLIPRDFHINLFEVQPWLKHHLHKDLPFLNDVVADHRCPTE